MVQPTETVTFNFRNIMTNYQHAKTFLKCLSVSVKKKFPDDKPLIRMEINNAAHRFCSELKLTDYQQNLLHNYACTLHPKDKAQRRSESYHASLLYGIDNQ